MNIDDLRDAVEKASAEQEAEATEPQEVTMGDIAAAAFIALETLVQILKPEDAKKVLDAYDTRRAAYTEADTDPQADD